MPIPLLPIAAGVAGLGAINSARQQGKANDLSDQAIQLALQDRADRAPLRNAFIQNVTRPIASAPDLSAAFADPSNPFAGPVDLPRVGSQLDFGSPGAVRRSPSGLEIEQELRALDVPDILRDEVMQQVLEKSALPPIPPTGPTVARDRRSGVRVRPPVKIPLGGRRSLDAETP